METKNCSICESPFTPNSNAQKYCETCSPPKNVIGGWRYQYWLFIISLNFDEIRALVSIKKAECNCVDLDIKKTRTCLKLLTQAYKRKCTYGSSKEAQE